MQSKGMRPRGLSFTLAKLIRSYLFRIGAKKYDTKRSAVIIVTKMSGLVRKNCPK